MMLFYDKYVAFHDGDSTLGWWSPSLYQAGNRLDTNKGFTLAKVKGTWGPASMIFPKEFC